MKNMHNRRRDKFMEREKKTTRRWFFPRKMHHLNSFSAQGYVFVRYRQSVCVCLFVIVSVWVQNFWHMHLTFLLIKTKGYVFSDNLTHCIEEKHFSFPTYDIFILRKHLCAYTHCAILHLNYYPPRLLHNFTIIKINFIKCILVLNSVSWKCAHQSTQSTKLAFCENFNKKWQRSTHISLLNLSEGGRIFDKTVYA